MSIATDYAEQIRKLEEQLALVPQPMLIHKGRVVAMVVADARLSVTHQILPQEEAVLLTKWLGEVYSD